MGVLTPLTITTSFINTSYPCRFTDLPICRFADLLDLLICRFADLLDLLICRFADLLDLPIFTDPPTDAGRV
jgi:hypothetical protein